MTNNYKYPRVMLFAPISDIKNYVIDEWMRCVTNLTYPNYGIVLVDNSENKQYRKDLQARYPGVTILHYPPNENGAMHIITGSQNVARKFVLDTLSEYAFSLECDVFPTFDVIERLMAHDKNICAATYPIREGAERKLLINLAKSNKFEFMQRELDADEALRFMDGKVKEIHSAGLGCVLMKRQVLERIQFRYVEGQKAYSDTYFALDAHFAGYQQYLDTSFTCRHESSDWKEKEAKLGGV